jgi:hypothetical protein
MSTNKPDRYEKKLPCVSRNGQMTAYRLARSCIEFSEHLREVICVHPILDFRQNI